MPAVPFHEYRYSGTEISSSHSSVSALFTALALSLGLQHWNSLLLLPFATHRQKPSSSHSACDPPSNVPFPTSTTGALGSSLLVPLHQVTAFHSALSKHYPRSTWTPEPFPHATSSQSPLGRKDTGARGRSSLTRAAAAAVLRWERWALAAWPETISHRNKYKGWSNSIVSLV